MTEKENTTQGIAGRGILLTIGNESPVADNTTIMLYMVSMAALKDNTPTAYFSPSMLSVEVVNRLIGIATGIDHNAIGAGTLSNEEWKRFDSVLPELMRTPLYIDDTPKIVLSELCYKISALVETKGVRLVVVNPLEKITVNDRSFEDVQQRIDCIAGELKAMAERLGITILAVEKLGRC